MITNKKASVLQFQKAGKPGRRCERVPVTHAQRVPSGLPPHPSPAWRRAQEH